MAPTRDADETEPGQAAADRVREELQAALDRYDIETARALEDYEDDRESSISVTNVYVDRSDPDRLRVQREPLTTLPPKRSRHETHPVPSLRPRADDPWWWRVLRWAGRGMHAHHKSIAITVICIVATLLAAALIWEGRISIVGVEPPRERPPWADRRHEPRRPRRGEPVAPGTVGE